MLEIYIEFPEGKVKQIMDRLSKAQREISDCYDELVNLGVVTIKKAPSEKDGTQMTCPVMDMFKRSLDRALQQAERTHRVIRFDEKSAQSACDNIRDAFLRFFGPNSLPIDKK